MTILDEIFSAKRSELVETKNSVPLAAVRSAAESAGPPMDCVAALTRSVTTPALIAEVKFASPSKGLLRRTIDPIELASEYQRNGAAAISVLTESRYFQGSLEYLADIRSHFDQQNIVIPLLRKDFLFDPYQVYEARAAGADALLLIAAMLDLACLRDLFQLTVESGMTPLVEAHNLDELETALSLNPTLIGINNRNLNNFKVNLDTSIELQKNVPVDVCLVSESGIHTQKDKQRLADAGIQAILVGEELVTAKNLAAKMRSLME